MSKNNPAIGFIFITIVIDVIGMGIIIPILPDLISELSDVGMHKITLYGGMLLFTYAFMQFIFAPVLGGLSDRFGRRPVLLIALLGFSLNYFFLAFAVNLFWLFLGRALAGLTGSSISIATAYIADISTPEKKAQNFGLISAAFGIGFTIGPALGGILGEYWTRLPFIVAGILSIMNFFYGYFVLRESLNRSDRSTFKLRQSNPISSLIHLKKYTSFTGLILAFFIIHTATHAIESLWPFYTIERFGWTTKEVGWSLAYVGLCVAVIHVWFIRFIIAKIGQTKTVYFGLFAFATGLLIMAFATKGWMMYIFLIPYIAGTIVLPTIQGIMSNYVSDSEQGKLQGTLTSLIALTTIIGPTIMTTIFALFINRENDLVYFPPAPLLLGVILMLIAIVFVYRSLQKQKKTADK